MPEPLPFPSQAHPNQPAQGFTPLQQFPASLGMTINNAQNQNTILSNATPFPSITGPGWQKILQVLANFGSNAGAGAALATNDALTGIGKTLAWPFEDTGPEQWNPSQPKAPGLQALSPGTDFIPQQGQGQMPGLGLEGLPSLDTTNVITGGLPIPKPPGTGKVPDYNPDFSKADQRLEAGKPKGHTQPGTPWNAFFTGAGKAAGQVDPRTPWATALAQMLSGGTAERQNFIQRQDMLDLQTEADQQRYQMQLAGVDEQRATTEAQMTMQRGLQEENMRQQGYSNMLRYWEARQPKVQANADGSTISTQIDENGNTIVQRVGFDDRLKADIAIRQAQALGGRSAGISAEMQAAARLGPMFLLGTLAQKAEAAGALTAILDPADLAILAEKDAAKQQELGLMPGLPPAFIAAKLKAEHDTLLFQLIMNNKAAYNRLKQYSFWGAQSQEAPVQSQGQFTGTGMTNAPY